MLLKSLVCYLLVCVIWLTTLFEKNKMIDQLVPELYIFFIFPYLCTGLLWFCSQVFLYLQGQMKSEALPSDQLWTHEVPPPFHTLFLLRNKIYLLQQNHTAWKKIYETNFIQFISQSFTLKISKWLSLVSIHIILTKYFCLHCFQQFNKYKTK